MKVREHLPEYYLPECKGCESWDSFYGCLDPCDLLNDKKTEEEIDRRREELQEGRIKE